MKKTSAQRIKTLLRNITLLIESYNTLPRWTSFVRVALGLPLGLSMTWAGFLSGASGAAATALSIVGIAVTLGTIIMIGGGILTANFWRKLEHLRRVASELPASR